MLIYYNITKMSVYRTTHNDIFCMMDNKPLFKTNNTKDK